MYDPFGNLLQQNVTSGSAPAMNLTVDPSTNRISTSGFVYDAAGNLSQSPTSSSPNTFSYDSQNRMTRASYAGGAAINYNYGANGERLYDGTYWHFYGPDGTHLETLTTNVTGGTFGSTVEELHFAGRLVFQDYYPVVTDRLGSVVLMGKGNGATYQSFYPYGQAITALAQPADAPPPNYGSVTYPATGSVSDVVFGTYHRDGALDYALNRYYDPARGRFTTADPYERSGRVRSPSSWNRYAYVEDDPINRTDPAGLTDWRQVRRGGILAVASGACVAGTATADILTAGAALVATGITIGCTGGFVQGVTQIISGFQTRGSVDPNAGAISRAGSQMNIPGAATSALTGGNQTAINVANNLNDAASFVGSVSSAVGVLDQVSVPAGQALSALMNILLNGAVAAINASAPTIVVQSTQPTVINIFGQFQPVETYTAPMNYDLTPSSGAGGGPSMPIDPNDVHENDNY